MYEERKVHLGTESLRPVFQFTFVYKIIIFSESCLLVPPGINAFCDFSQPVQTNFGAVPLNRQLTSPFESFTDHIFRVIASFHSELCDLCR